MSDSTSDLMPDAGEHLYSAGYACQLLEATLDRLKMLMRHAGVRFCKVVDGVPYLTDDALQKVMDTREGEDSQ